MSLQIFRSDRDGNMETLFSDDRGDPCDREDPCDRDDPYVRDDY